METKLEIRIKKELGSEPGRITLTEYRSSCTLFRVYVPILVHWIDLNGELSNELLYYKRFSTPHTGYSTCTSLFELLEYLNLLNRVRLIKTENVSGIFQAYQNYSKR